MAIYKDVEPLEVVSYQGENEDFDRGVAFVLEKLDALPTADVAEVKHGYWYKHNKKIHGDTCYHCSVCEEMALSDCMIWELTDFCPHCGAKMDGERAENETNS